MKKVGDDENLSTTVFDVFFCNGELETEFKAAQGTSANILPKNVYQQICKREGVNLVQKLARQVTFDVFNKATPRLTCDFKVIADRILDIHHPKNIILLNVNWLVVNEQTSKIFIGRQLLQALGLKKRVPVTAAMSRVGEHVNIPILYASSKMELERHRDINKILLALHNGRGRG